MFSSRIVVIQHLTKGRIFSGCYSGNERKRLQENSRDRNSAVSEKIIASKAARFRAPFLRENFSAKVTRDFLFLTSHGRQVNAQRKRACCLFPLEDKPRKLSGLAAQAKSLCSSAARYFLYIGLSGKSGGEIISCSSSSPVTFAG
jgi:hypothetical protein